MTPFSSRKAHHFLEFVPLGFFPSPTLLKFLTNGLHHFKYFPYILFTFVFVLFNILFYNRSQYFYHFYIRVFSKMPNVEKDLNIQTGRLNS